MLVLDRGSRVFLRDGQTVAVFLPESMRLFSAAVPDAVPWSELEAQLQTPRDLAIAPAPATMGDALAARRAMLPVLIDRQTLRHTGVRPTLTRLTLNISNACNLWCSYCYADHGHYHEPASLMPPDVGAAIVERVLDLYSGVRRVQFFGGEPLLNLPAIESVCGALADAAERDPERSLPAFCATTNGTLSSPNVIESLRRWNVDLTVSWDGPREVHDRNRPMSGGASSYDRLVESLARYRDAGVGYDIECTYTKQHLEAGLTVTELMDFFAERTEQRTFHIAPVFLPAPVGVTVSAGSGQRVFRGSELAARQIDHLQVDRLIPLYRQAARYTVENVFKGSGPLLGMARGIIEQILQQTRSTAYCPAFFEQLSIAIDGSAYPCFMFIGDPAFRMGNVLTDEFPTASARSIMSRYFGEFGLETTGSTSWHRGLAGGCVAGEYIATGSLGVRAVAPLFEAMIEECLIGIARLGPAGVIPELGEPSRKC